MTTKTLPTEFLAATVARLFGAYVRCVAINSDTPGLAEPLA